ncbi:hypothetical protein ABZ918_29150, partial [Streptomyces viridosporus]|uniref:hypothetical protein n=1 Tax=Streptomyces viridosporus TaxID=67581 RepID=UPI003438D96A
MRRRSGRAPSPPPPPRARPRRARLLRPSGRPPPGLVGAVQYLAHTYRQLGDHEEFAEEIEQILRGT